MKSLHVDLSRAVTRELPIIIGKVISHYGIPEKLSGGGMDMVYTAEDTEFHRFVALSAARGLLKDIAPWSVSAAMQCGLKLRDVRD
jgi:hypothetical protein